MSSCWTVGSGQIAVCSLKMPLFVLTSQPLMGVFNFETLLQYIKSPPSSNILLELVFHHIFSQCLVNVLHCFWRAITSLWPSRSVTTIYQHSQPKKKNNNNNLALVSPPESNSIRLWQDILSVCLRFAGKAFWPKGETLSFARYHEQSYLSRAPLCFGE